MASARDSLAATSLEPAEPAAPSGRMLALDGEQLERQDESNKLLAARLSAESESNLAGATEPEAGQQDSGQHDHDDEQAHFLASAKASERPVGRVQSEKWPLAEWPARAQHLKWDQKRELGAHLAKQESVFEREDQKAAEAAGLQQDKKQTEKKKKKQEKKKARELEKSGQADGAQDEVACRSKMLAYLFTPLLLLLYAAAIYCLPFVQVQPATVAPLPVIPFNFQEGPLRASSASAFKIKHLFRDQVHGPESLALDAQGNLYMAIEGGFVLFAHLNRSSPIRRVYLDSALGVAVGELAWQEFQRTGAASSVFAQSPELIKIAELNGPKPVAGARRPQRDTSSAAEPLAPSWKRDCQLDEQVYGQTLNTLVIDQEAGESAGEPPQQQQDAAMNKERAQKQGAEKRYHFKSQVRVSRCSKPLGIRLSPDESTLYVVDTLSGLYRINLRQPAQHRAQVSKLLDFKVSQVVPVVQLSAVAAGEQQTREMNVSMRAIDDLSIEFGAGSRGADLIYLTVASQSWPATSFVFDSLEGRPSGLVMRLDVGASERPLVVLEPGRVAHVRNSNMQIEGHNETHYELARRSPDNSLLYLPSVTLGAPRLNENDHFDDRPLNFPNGIELMQDGQALLIADTSNRRIIKHWIRGPRRGTSDLWAWTPHLPDNIRRGFDARHETYWVVGCGRAPKLAGSQLAAEGEGKQQSARQREPAREMFQRHLKINSDNWDVFKMLHNWPRVRKFALKNFYFAGALVEFVGAHVLHSTRVQDFGYELKTGSSMCANGCMGMMVLQYNRHGDIIRSIHSREFPNDLFYYSQVNEFIDTQAAEHALFLGSPSYNYVTKLILPTETRPLESNWPHDHQ